MTLLLEPVALYYYYNNFNGVFHHPIALLQYINGIYLRLSFWNIITVRTKEMEYILLLLLEM